MDSSIAEPKIRVISFSKEDLKPGTSLWRKTCKHVCVALEENGCFEATREEISLDLHNTMYGALAELYDLPMEIKSKNVSDKPYNIYFSSNPIHESLGTEDLTNPEEAHKFTNLMWPHRGHDRLRESAHSMAKIMKELDQTVTRMIFENYGVEKYYESHMKSMDYALRFTKYKNAEVDEKKEKVRIAFLSHTDKSFTSILHQDQAGLQVQTKEGEWVLYDPVSPSSLIFIAADALKVWSNGRIQPCPHRVIMKEKERYSIGLFAFSQGVIHVPEELVDDEHPLRFKPFDHLEFYKTFMMSIKQKPYYTVEDHCGV